MAITDLLSRIPIPPPFRRGGASVDPTVPLPDASWQADAWSGYATLDAPANPGFGAPRPAAALPSWAVLALASLTLTTLGLAVLLVLGIRSLAASEPAAPAAPTADWTAPEATPVGVPPVDAASDPQPAGADAASGTFADEPLPVPADVIARLEAASNEPLHGELAQLLAAIQHGFGGRSSQLDPALRSYTARMASRFEWNPDTFRVAVTAPVPALADARAATLRHLFGDAVVSRRLEIQTATGPDALSLVSR